MLTALEGEAGSAVSAQVVGDFHRKCELDLLSIFLVLSLSFFCNEILSLETVLM
jgi:hypothetical protein